MSTTRPADMSDCVLGTGRLDDRTGQIYDARSMQRATAQRSFAADWGLDFAEVRCTTCWARWLTVQEQWDEGGSEDWADDLIDNYPGEAQLDEHLVWRDVGTGESIEHLFEPPSRPPADWEADEYASSWTFCDRDHPEAVKVYLCEERKAGSPASKDGQQ